MVDRPREQFLYRIKRFYDEVVPVLVYNNTVTHKIYTFLFVNETYKYYHILVGNIEPVLKILEDLSVETATDILELFTHAFMYTAGVGRAIDLLEKRGYVEMGSMFVRRTPLPDILAARKAEIESYRGVAYNIGEKYGLPNNVLNVVGSFAVAPDVLGQRRILSDMKHKRGGSRGGAGAGTKTRKRRRSLKRQTRRR